jgi:hypothetical protein
MTLIELTVGDFDYAMERGVRFALLGLGVSVTRRHRDGVYWAVAIHSQWSFFYRYRSWCWQPRRKGER